MTTAADALAEPAADGFADPGCSPTGHTAGSLCDDAASDSTLCGASTAANSALPFAKPLDRRTTTGFSTVSTSGDVGAGSDTASDAATAAGMTAVAESGNTHKYSFTDADVAAAMGISLMEGLPGLRTMPLRSQSSGSGLPPGGASPASPSRPRGGPGSGAGAGPAGEERPPTTACQQAEIKRTDVTASATYVKVQPTTTHKPVVPPLHKAAAEGDVAAVLKLLLRGTDPNEEDALLGETPLFEAAAVDAAAVVGLLLLFGADAARRGRHTTAMAPEFAPAGGAAAALLGAWARGDRRRLAEVLTPVLRALAEDGCEEAGPVLARLEAEAAAAARAAAAAARRAGVEGAGSAEAGHDWSPPPPTVVFGDFSDWVPDLTERSLPTPSSSLLTTLQQICERLGSQERLVPHGSRLFSPDSSAAHALWASVAAYEPQAALSVLPTACCSMAALLLGDSDDAAWRHAAGCVAYDVAARDRRRRAADGRPLSWRSTFQELATQKIFCWGTDGIITGFGARAPVKVYSRPRALPLEPQAAGAVLARPFVRAIACGRRHSAAVTFSGSVYVWGRDVAPPAQPPDEARAGLEAWTAWRSTQSRLATSSDRPRRLMLGRLPTPPPPGPVEERPPPLLPPPDAAGAPEAVDVVGLSATSSVTLLRLSGGQTVCTGGWTAQEAQLPERVAEAAEARRRAPRLPPLRKITRGFCFNVALSRDGRVFVWRHSGLARNVQQLRLIRGSRQISGLVPTGIIDTVPVEPTSILPPGDVAADIAVGEGHVLILTEAGRVWSFGWRQLSALGRGPKLSTASAIVPTLINGLERIVQISAGATYSLCVDIDGSLWLFGEGPCIAGCFNHPTSVNEPRKVPSSVFGGRRVLAAACGDGHVLVLTAWDPCRRLLQPGAWFADGDRCQSTSLDSMPDAVVGEWTP